MGANSCVYAKKRRCSPCEHQKNESRSFGLKKCLLRTKSDFSNPKIPWPKVIFSLGVLPYLSCFSNSIFNHSTTSNQEKELLHKLLHRCIPLIIEMNPNICLDDSSLTIYRLSYGLKNFKTLLQMTLRWDRANTKIISKKTLILINMLYIRDLGKNFISGSRLFQRRYKIILKLLFLRIMLS